MEKTNVKKKGAKVFNAIVVSFVVVAVLSVFVFGSTTTPIRIAEVRNGDLALRHYYDYRKGAPINTYFAKMQDGKPIGLYAVELRGSREFSRNKIVQFSAAGVSDSNPGTLITTVPADSKEAISYYQTFAEVLAKYESQKWWERVFYQ